MGPFFDNSVSLVNCSIGEPFMMKNIDELLDAFGNAGKVLEMTTNGQILTDRNIRTLLGRPIDLYVSLDAGTPDTYAKLRNQRFSTILENLRRLVEAKGGPGALPHVHLVFMPMRVNVGELEQFVRIAADLRVDRLVLRPLNYSDGIALDWERGGYRFEYQRELLPFEELVRVSGRAAELCRRYGVELADQMDFGGDLGERFAELFQEGRQSVMVEPGGEATREATPPGGDESSTQTPDASAVVAGPAGAPVSPPSVTQSVESHDALAGPSFDGQLALADGHSAPIEVRPVAMPAEAARPSLGAERKPACTEPWRSLYILRRGVLPCCYGGAPIADMTGVPLGLELTAAPGHPRRAGGRTVPCLLPEVAGVSDRSQVGTGARAARPPGGVRAAAARMDPLRPDDPWRRRAAVALEPARGAWRASCPDRSRVPEAQIRASSAGLRPRVSRRRPIGGCRRPRAVPGRHRPPGSRSIPPA